jgi:hypothetical protein
MSNLEKAKLIIRKAEKDKANYSLYNKALMTLASMERKSGDPEMADFILRELSEALVVATGTP